MCSNYSNFDYFKNKGSILTERDTTSSQMKLLCCRDPLAVNLCGGCLGSQQVAKGCLLNLGLALCHSCEVPDISHCILWNSILRCPVISQPPKCCGYRCTPSQQARPDLSAIATIRVGQRLSSALLAPFQGSFRALGLPFSILQGLLCMQCRRGDPQYHVGHQHFFFCHRTGMIFPQ